MPPEVIDERDLPLISKSRVRYSAGFFDQIRHRSCREAPQETCSQAASAMCCVTGIKILPAHQSIGVEILCDAEGYVAKTNMIFALFKQINLIAVFVTIASLSSTVLGAYSDDSSSDGDGPAPAPYVKNSNNLVKRILGVNECQDTHHCCRILKKTDESYDAVDNEVNGFNFLCYKTVGIFLLDCGDSDERHIAADGAGHCFFSSGAERGAQPFGGFFSRSEVPKVPSVHGTVYVPVDTRPIVNSVHTCMEYTSSQ